MRIAVYKRIDYVRFEFILHVENIEGNVQVSCNSLRIGHIGRRTTPIVIILARIPETHHNAKHILATICQQTSGNGAVNATAHGNRDFTIRHLFFLRLGEVVQRGEGEHEGTFGQNPL